MKTFAKWPEELHSEPDQVTRIKSAQKKETTPDSIDKERQRGTFSGSGKEPYRTTLYGCTCRDFILRKKPCKHMYRLAMECGLFDGDFQEGTNKNDIKKAAIPLDQAIAEVEKLPEEMQEYIDGMLYGNIYHGEGHRIIDGSKYAQLLTCGLFVQSEADPKEYFSTLKKSDLVAAISNMDDAPVKAKKADIVNWMAEKGIRASDINPNIIAISFLPEMDLHKRKLYSYFRQKFY